MILYIHSNSINILANIIFGGKNQAITFQILKKGESVMAYLKPDSVPAQQEVEARKAIGILEKKSKEVSRSRKKSYVVTSSVPLESSPDLSPPFNKPFGRG